MLTSPSQSVCCAFDDVVSHAQNGMLRKDKCVVPHVQYSVSNRHKDISWLTCFRWMARRTRCTARACACSASCSWTTRPCTMMWTPFSSTFCVSVMPTGKLLPHAMTSHTLTQAACSTLTPKHTSACGCLFHALSFTLLDTCLRAMDYPLSLIVTHSTCAFQRAKCTTAGCVYGYFNPPPNPALWPKICTQGGLVLGNTMAANANLVAGTI